MSTPPLGRGFASDNCAGVHPRILEAVAAANTGHVPSYGADPFTRQAVQRFQDLFGNGVEVFFVCNGTAANVLSFRAVCRSFNAILAADSAHLHVDECGAPEFHTGCKVLAIQGRDGKLTPGDLDPHLRGFGFEHHAQPRVVSITQATEFGTVYRPIEVRRLADHVHAKGLYLHMDGARLANACAFLGLDVREVTREAGVDILSFGGTKNGILMGEAVVFFDHTLAADFAYIRKQELQLVSKMRFIAAQFDALLTDGLWLELAGRANRMASRLADGVRGLRDVTVTRPVESNAVFARIPNGWIEKLHKKHPFYVWNDHPLEVRWMTAFDTTEADVDAFVECLAGLSEGGA